MATTFISCLFQYNETVLESWIGSEIRIILFVKPSDYETVSLKLRGNTNITLNILPKITELEWYTNADSLRLPSVRNEKKDTLEHLWKMHLKI